MKIVEINLEDKYVIIKTDMNVSVEEIRGIIEELGFEFKSLE